MKVEHKIVAIIALVSVVLIGIIVLLLSLILGIKEVDVYSLDTDTRNELLNHIKRGEKTVIERDGDYYAVIATGGKSSSPIEYSIDDKTITYWLGNDDGKFLERYVVLKVRDKQYDIQKAKETLPIESSVVDAIITKVGDGVFSVYCTEYGNVGTVNSSDNLESGLYTVTIRSEDSKLILDSYTKINSIKINGKVISTLGVYDNIMLERGDTISIKNRNVKLNNEEVELIIGYENNEYVLLSQLN